MLENMADGGDDGHQMCGGETRDVGSLFVCVQAIRRNNMYLLYRDSEPGLNRLIG